MMDGFNLGNDASTGQETESESWMTVLSQIIFAAQVLVRRYIPKGVCLVEELHAERRKDSTFD